MSKITSSKSDKFKITPAVGLLFFISLVMGLLLIFNSGVSSQTSDNLAFNATTYQDVVRFKAEGNNVSSIQVQIYSANGSQIFKDESNDSYLDWDKKSEQGEELANGVYLYSIKAEKEDGSTQRSKVGRMLVGISGVQVSAPSGEQELESTEGLQGGEFLGAAVPQYSGTSNDATPGDGVFDIVGNLSVNEGWPTVSFNDTNPSSSWYLWHQGEGLHGSNPEFGLWDEDSGIQTFLITNRSGRHDFNVPNGRLAVGYDKTTAPPQELSVSGDALLTSSGSYTDLVLKNTSSGGSAWYLSSESIGNLSLFNSTSNNFSLIAQPDGSLTLGGAPSLGTSTTLEVYGDQAMDVSNMSSPAGIQFITGSTATSDVPNPGLFAQMGTGSERLDFGWGGQGGGNMEFYSKDNSKAPGELRFVYGGGTNIGALKFIHYDGSSWNYNLVVDEDGTFDFKGNSLINTNFASDRALKENFQSVDDQQVLNKLADMPIKRWNYKDYSPGAEHIGPVAQEFNSAFGLNETEDGINPVDAYGVSMVSIQALYEENRKQDERIEALEEKVKNQEGRIERLEEQVQALMEEREGTDS